MKKEDKFAKLKHRIFFNAGLSPEIMKKIIFILIGLIIITGALGYFYYQRNIFRQDRLRFEITAPESVKTGEEVEYLIRYRNNSDTRLENVVLLFEYPEDALPIETEEDDDITRRGGRRREVKIGELNPGEERTTSFSARFFGKEGATMEASAWIRYVPRNLAARFEAKREHVAVISEVPIDLDLQVPSAVDPNKEESFRILFSSDIDYPLTDLELRVGYPSGFNFVRSAPQTDAAARNEWSIPVLNKGDSGTVDIDGVIGGSPGDARVFNAVLGIWKEDRFITLKEVSRGTSIARSSLILDIQVNGETEYVAEAGELLHYEVFFRNIGRDTLENLFLLVDLDKDTLNMDQIEPVEGRFQEDRGVIIWSHTFDYVLQSLGSDEDGSVEFWARVKEDLPYDPEVKVEAKMERAEKSLATKVNTRLSLDRKVVREGSPFEPKGPFPFEEGEVSTYTVKWEIESLFSSMEDVVVSSRLPEGARATGEKESDRDVTLSYSSGRREVEVELEELPAGTPAEIFFEVEIDPLFDFEDEDEVLGETNVSGKDKRTQNEISGTLPGVFFDEILEISL